MLYITLTLKFTENFMASLFSEYLTDKNSEKTGVWVDFDLINDDGTSPSFLLARVSPENRTWNSQLQALKRKYRKDYDQLSTDEVVNYVKDMVNLYSSCIVLDWRNFKLDAKLDKDGNFVKDKDGNVVCEEIPYSYANAVTYFNQMPILFNWIAEKSADYKN